MVASKRQTQGETAFFNGNDMYKFSPRMGMNPRSSQFLGRGSFLTFAQSFNPSNRLTNTFSTAPSTPTLSTPSPSYLSTPSASSSKQVFTIAKHLAAFAVVYFRHLAEHDPKELFATLNLYSSIELPPSKASILMTKETTLKQLMDSCFGVILPMSLSGLSDKQTQSIRHVSIAFPSPDSDDEKDKWSLTLDLSGRNGFRSPKLSFDYNGNHSAIRKFVPLHVKSIAEQIVSQSALKVSQVQFLAEDEITLLSRYSTSPFRLEENESDPKLLHEYFELNAKKYFNRIALSWNGEDLSYEYLNYRANQLALFLQSKGVKSRTYVGIFMSKSIELYLSILAVLKLGAAYLPLDLSFPPDRVQFILQDCDAHFLLINAPLPSLLEEWKGTPLNVPELFNPLPLKETENSEVVMHERIGEEDIAYVIYTSGTTGMPKGVMIRHSNICFLVKSEHYLFETRCQDRVAQGFSVAFDASLEEIWMGWGSGAALIPVPEETMKSPDSLPQFLLDNQVNVFSTVPTLLSLLEYFPSLRLLILGGEVCPSELLLKWNQNDTRIVNSYGPTETTVVSTAADFTPGVKLTIGRPIPGYQIMVMDQNGELVPFGAPGELCIGGKAVAAGYLNRPELTDSKFKEIEENLGNGFKGRIYKTGDLVRLTETGTIEFLGRIDTQVKIRGFRVELAEIEALLLQCNNVKNSAVAVKLLNGVQMLVAYIVSSEGKELEEEEMKKHLRSRLAPYMIPNHFVKMNAFPLLTSGKVDRKQLPDPSPSHSSSSSSTREVHLPDGPIETLLYSAWKKYLGISQLCVEKDDFFFLGGNSLLASMVVSHLRQLPPFRSISVKDIYQQRTIRAISNLILSNPENGQLALQVPSILLTENEDSISISIETNVKAGEVMVPMEREYEKREQPVNPSVRFFTSFLQLMLMFYSIVIGVGFIQLLLYFREQLDYWWYVMIGGFVFFSSIFYIPVACFTSIVFKWVLIGRFEPGEHPLWGWFYFRFWFAKIAMGAAPLGLLSSTPFLPYFYRLMGAKVGDGVYIGSTRISCFDLLELGDGASIAKEACLMGYRVEAGKLIIGNGIKVGKNGYVGLRSIMEGGTSVGDHSQLSDLSVLLTGSHVPNNQSWGGSPAVFEEKKEKVDNQCKVTIKYLFQQYCAFWLIGFIPVIPTVISVGSFIVSYILLSRALPWQQTLWIMALLIFPIAGLFIFMMMLTLFFFKRVIAGRSSEKFELYKGEYIRHWIGEVVLSMSLTFLKSIYATIYARYWMRMLGAQIGSGSEVSTVNHISSDHLIVEKDAFLADSTSIGAPRVQYGYVTVQPTVVGEKTFIGNSAVMASGTVLGKNCLIGALSVSPKETPPDNTNWVGSPSFIIPSRAVSTAFGSNLTFSPPVHLVLFRGFVEIFKIVLPSIFLSFTVLPWFFFCVWQLTIYPWWRCWIQAVALLFGLLGFFTLLTILLKWILVGKYRTMEKPLWSSYVWRNELINSLCESYVFPLVVNPLLGTPFAPFFFRMMGSHFGSYVYMDTVEITEFDLVWVADYVCLNNGVTLQTHLFEDRIMKMSHLKIGRNSTIGTSSVVLYDTVIGPNVSLRSLSLVMKGESLPGDTCWQGIPSSFLREN